VGGFLQPEPGGPSQSVGVEGRSGGRETKTCVEAVLFICVRCGRFEVWEEHLKYSCAANAYIPWSGRRCEEPDDLLRSFGCTRARLVELALKTESSSWCAKCDVVAECRLRF